MTRGYKCSISNCIVLIRQKRIVCHMSTIRVGGHRWVRGHHHLCPRRHRFRSSDLLPLPSYLSRILSKPPLQSYPATVKIVARKIGCDFKLTLWQAERHFCHLRFTGAATILSFGHSMFTSFDSIGSAVGKGPIGHDIATSE